MTGMRGPALFCDAVASHEDVIDLLLEYGADPNERGSHQRGTLLSCAAKAGSISLARKFLGIGVEVDVVKDGWAVWYAIKREHTELAEMMLQLGTNQERRLKAKIGYTRELGLESMVELLERWFPEGNPLKPQQA